MFQRQAGLVVVAVSLYLIMGCASQQTPHGVAYGDSNLVAVAYTIADKLVATEWFDQLFGPSDPLIVATFADINHLEESSSFGRILSEQIGSRLVQRSLKVIDLKLRQISSSFMTTQACSAES